MNKHLEKSGEGREIQSIDMEISEPMHQEILLFELSASLSSIKESLGLNKGQKSLTLVNEMQIMLGQLEQELLA